MFNMENHGPPPASTTLPAQRRAGAAKAETGDGYQRPSAVARNLCDLFRARPISGGPVHADLLERSAKKRPRGARDRQKPSTRQVEKTPAAKEIFIQSGDIREGGPTGPRAERSLCCSPIRGPLAIRRRFSASEGSWSARGGREGRWRRRGGFSRANASLPSRAAKIGMAATRLPQSGAPRTIRSASGSA